MVGGKLVNQLNNIEGAGGKPQVTLQGQEAINRLTPDYGIQISPPSQRYLAMSDKLKVSRQLTSGAPDPLGYALNLTEVGGVEGKDSIRFTQLNLLDNDCSCLISSWLWHFGLLLVNLFPSI